jgi:tetratricopeptide (TPR) repeat protein
MTDGLRMLADQQYEDALAYFEARQGVQALFGQAVALQLLGHFEDAEETYLRVLAIDTRHVETLSNLIALSIERFDLESVESYSKRLLELNPSSSIALQGLVVVAVERRDFETAAACFSRLKPVENGGRDAVEYRLSRQIVERLRDHDGSLARPY